MQAMRESRTRVTTRIPKLLREHLEQAAAFRGMQLGSFILEAAAEKADSILERERVIHLAAADAEVIARSIAHPPKPNAAMRAAAKNFKKHIRVPA